MLSLRGFSTALCLVCVVVASTLAAYLAIESADAALSDTKEQRDGALDRCFDTSMRIARTQAQRHLASLEADIATFVGGYITNARAMAEALTVELHHTPIEDALNWEWLASVYPRKLWNLVHAKLQEIAILGITTVKEQFIGILEDEHTMSAPADHHHVIRLMMCNGTDYGPTRGRTFLSDAEWGTGQLLGGRLGDPGMSCGGYYMCSHPHDRLCDGRSEPANWTLRCQQSGGAEFCCVCNRKCQAPESGPRRLYNGSEVGVDVADYDGCQRPAWMVRRKCVPERHRNVTLLESEMGQFWMLGSLLVPHGHVRFAPLLPADGYVGIGILGNWAPVGSERLTASLGTAGIVIVGCDTRHISAYLQRLPLAGLSRVFVVYSGSDLGLVLEEHLRSRGFMLGASDGPTYGQRDDGTAMPIKPEESSDPVIGAVGRNIASRADGTDSGYEVLMQEQSRNGSTDMVVDLSGGGAGAERTRFVVRVAAERTESAGFWLVTAFDYDEMFGEIERTSADTRRAVQESNDQVSAELEKDRTALFIILASVAVGLGLVAVACSFAIVAPLRKLGDEMQDVSRMKLDGVSKKLSFLSEIARCQSAFILMAEALAEYREFLPQSVLTAGEPEEEEDEVEEEENKSVSEKRAETEATRRRFTGNEVASQSSTTNPHDTRRVVNARGLTRRRCTLAFIGVHKWHLVLDDAAHNTLGIISHFIQGIMQDSDAAKGLCDNFSGDRVMVTFNAARTTPGHRLAAMRLGLSAQNTDPCRWWVGHPDCHVTIALVSGELWCGNAGPSGMVRSSVLGPVVPWGHALQRYTQTHPGLQRKTATFLDGGVAADVSVVAETRIIVLAKYAKRSAKQTPVSELLHEKTGEAGDEWMYQLAHAENCGEFREWNSSFLAALQLLSDGVPDAAARKISQLAEIPRYRNDPYLTFLLGTPADSIAVDLAGM